MRIKYLILTLCIFSYNSLSSMSKKLDELDVPDVITEQGKNWCNALLKFWKEQENKPILLVDLSAFNLVQETLHIAHKGYTSQFVNIFTKNYGATVRAGDHKNPKIDTTTLFGAMLTSLFQDGHYNPYDLFSQETVQDYSHTSYFIKTETEECPRTVKEVGEYLLTRQGPLLRQEKEIPPLLCQAFFISTVQQEKDFWNSVTTALSTKNIPDVAKKLVLTKLKASFIPDDQPIMKFNIALGKLMLRYKKEGCKIILLANTPIFYNYWFEGHNQDDKLFDHMLFSNETGCLTTDKGMLEKVVERCKEEDPKNYIIINPVKKNLTAAESVGMHGITYTNALDLEKQIASYVKKLQSKKG